MHSLETGIIISIAMFFFLSFLTFTFLRERTISEEITAKFNIEKREYEVNESKKYKPELICNIISIISEGNDVRENEE